MGLMIAAAVVIVFLVFLFFFVLFDMAVLPGRIAKERAHPQADAVKMAGILGILTFVLWPLALIWAYHHPTEQADRSVRKSEKRKRTGSLKTSSAASSQTKIAG